MSLVVTSAAIAVQVRETGPGLVSSGLSEGVGLAAIETNIGRAENLDAVPPQRAWPCQLIVAQDLRAFAELAWNASATFREQCRKLAAAGAVVLVYPASSRESWRAEARIGATHDCLTFARVRVRRTGAAVEWLAHELEHVLERTEGVKFLMESTRGGSRVSLSGGAFETQLAIDAGRRVAAEIREAARMDTQ